MSDDQPANLDEEVRRQLTFDWRTRDPETIRGEGPGIEALRYYREKIEDLLRDYEGQYVLIADREILANCPDLETAARVSRTDYPGRQVCIKKVVAIDQIHTLGAAAYWSVDRSRRRSGAIDL